MIVIHGISIKQLDVAEGMRPKKKSIHLKAPDNCQDLVSPSAIVVALNTLSIVLLLSSVTSEGYYNLFQPWAYNKLKCKTCNRKRDEHESSIFSHEILIAHCKV
jgi:hypothetical protein